MGVYIGWVIVDRGVADKIRQKHKITPDEVREACGGHTHARWHVHPRHGPRLLVIGDTYEGRRLKMILHPVDESDGTWRLATALVAE